MHSDSHKHQQMADMIERWQQSKLSQVQFCKQEGISYYRFQYWRKKFGQENNWHQPAADGFVKLKVKDPMQTAAAIEIHFPGGARLFFHQAVAADYIRKLLS